MTKVTELAFGAPAAERDIGQGLADYFVDTQAFNRVQGGSKTVLVGNRGTGKSAIFQVLAARERHRRTLVVELAPEDYSYEMLSRTMASEQQGSWAKIGAYAVAWKYLVYLEVMKGLSRMGLGKQPAEAAIQRYLRDNHKGFQTNPLSSLISYLKRIEGVKVGPYEASIGVRELERLYKLEEIKDLLPAIATVCEKQQVMILVDELDRGWDASEDAKAFVAGLFQACIAINRLTPNLRVYMSLRQELFGYLVARTLHRPRELISFCTEVLETAQAMRQQPPFDYSVVSEAEMAYSEERTKDIAAEYRHQYPGLLSVFEHFRGGHSTLDRDELEQLCMELALGERRISEPAGWIVDQDPDSVIDVLWRVGFLTAKAGRSNPRAGTGGRFVGPHQVAHLTLANVREFQVHPMFRAYLGLTDEIVLDEAPPDRALNGRGPSRR